MSIHGLGVRAKIIQAADAVEGRDFEGAGIPDADGVIGGFFGRDDRTELIVIAVKERFEKARLGNPGRVPVRRRTAKMLPPRSLRDCGRVHGAIRVSRRTAPGSKSGLLTSAQARKECRSERVSKKSGFACLFLFLFRLIFLRQRGNEEDQAELSRDDVQFTGKRSAVTQASSLTGRAAFQAHHSAPHRRAGCPRDASGWKPELYRTRLKTGPFPGAEGSTEISRWRQPPD